MRVQMRYVVILAIILVIVTIPASAHSQFQEGILEKGYIQGNYNNYFIGGENIGWAVMENRHSGTTSINYKFVGVTQQKKNLLSSAATMWNSVASFYEDSSSLSIITMGDYGDAFIAGVYVDPADIDPVTGHVSKWTMYINTYFDTYQNGEYAFNAVVAAHELGHVIGLTDLYTNSNTDKLMYAYADDSTATGPSASDIKGAKVILGLHTSHRFNNYRYWGENTLGNKYHVAYCLVCNGNSATKSACVFDSIMGICLVCGATQ